MKYLEKCGGGISGSKFRQILIGTLNQGANVAPMAIVRYQIKTQPYLQSVTSQPTLGEGVEKNEEGSRN